MNLPSGLSRSDASDVGTLRRQLVVLSAIVSSAVALALVVIVQFLLAGAAADAIHLVLEDRADGVIAASDLTGPEPSVPAAQLAPGVAVYDRAGRLIAGDIPPALRQEFDTLSTTTSASSTEASEFYRVLAKPVIVGGEATGVVVVAEPTAPYESDERSALIVSLVSGALLVLLAVSLTAWATRRALAPVGEMARVAEEWSERELGRRFELGDPTNEIKALGNTLDGLLERVEHAILAEQRLTAELAHELRSPLTAIQATAELVAMRTDLDDELRDDVTTIRDQSQAMARTISGLLDLARAQASEAAQGSCLLAQVVDAIRRDSNGPGVISVEVDDELAVAAPRELVRRCLGPVVDNAVRLARLVSVTAAVRGREVVVTVLDDGPGIAPAMSSHLFEPGHTGGGGSGLGLALSRRIARGVGGDVVFVPASDGEMGARFQVTLPLA